MRKRFLSLLTAAAVLSVSFNVPVLAEPAYEDVSGNSIETITDDVQISDNEIGADEESGNSDDIITPAEQVSENIISENTVSANTVSSNDPAVPFDELINATGYIDGGEEVPASVHNKFESESDVAIQATLPSAYVNKYILGLRNQNPYGSCWAFSAVGMMEASYKT